MALPRAPAARRGYNHMGRIANAPGQPQGKGTLREFQHPTKGHNHFLKNGEGLGNESLGLQEGKTMTVCRALPLVAVIVAMPCAAGAQFGGMPGLPGGPPGGVPGVGGFGAPPATPAPPPACQQLLALRDEVQKHGMAIQKANERKASVQEACKLFRTYLSAEAKFIRGLEENSRTCGVPPDAIKQAKERHAKAGQVGRQVCEAAALGPTPAGRIPWDALREGTEKQGQSGDDNCDLCGKTGDFWWTIPPPGPR